MQASQRWQVLSSSAWLANRACAYIRGTEYCPAPFCLLMLCDALAALARLLVLLRLWLGRRRLLFASWGVIAAEVRATGGAAAGVDG